MSNRWLLFVIAALLAIFWAGVLAIVWEYVK